MQQRTAHIPGKLMLSGEYAVLDGAPAILACVDPIARATGAFGGQSGGRLLVLADHELEFEWRWTKDQLHWSTPTPPALVDAMLRAIPDRSLQSLRVDSRELFVGNRKLGLGSSAAVAVAIGAVLAGDLSSETVARIDGAHRCFQGGVGSGADIHAVATGGVVRFQPDENTVALSLPSDLFMQPVIAPRSVSTPDRIGRYRLWQQSPSAAPLCERLCALARQVAEDWMKASASEILSGMRSYLGIMSEVSKTAELEYLSGGHAQLLGPAEQSGVVYKPCGAGGGDIGIALADDPEALNRFGSVALEMGFSVPGWRVGSAGPSGDGVMGATR